MKICHSCRIAYDDKFSFCKKCGQKLSDYQEQHQDISQVPVSGVESNNNTNEKTDSKKGIIIVGACIILALIGFFAFGGNFSKDKNAKIDSSSQKTTALTNSGMSKSKVKEEVNKEAKAVADINAKNNQQTSNASGQNNDGVSLPFEPKLKGYINGTEVFMRSGPGKQYNTVGYFNKGEIVEVLDAPKGSEWIYVRTANSKKAWVFSQYFSGFPVEMPSSELSLGGIVPLNTTLRDVKNMYGEPTDKKVFEGEGVHVVTYSYGSLLKVFGRTGIPRDKNSTIIEDNLIVTGYSMKANNLATRAGLKVGMPYRNVAELYGTGQIHLDKDKGNSYVYSNKQLQSISFYTDNSGIITEIYVGQDW